MKIKDIVTALCLLAIGIAIGFYLGKNVWPPEKVIVMRFNSVGDMIVGAAKGAELEWYDGSAAAPVNFKHGFQPCANSLGPDYKTCTLKDSGLYTFNCKGCKDPVVGGGDDTFRGGHQLGFGVSPAPPAYPGPATADIYCDPATSTAKADLVQGHQGQVFALQLVGPASFTGFTATFRTAGTCDPGDALNKSSPTCLIKPAVTASKDYTYDIMVTPGCAPGIATLTELP